MSTRCTGFDIILDEMKIIFGPGIFHNKYNLPWFSVVADDELILMLAFEFFENCFKTILRKLPEQTKRDKKEKHNLLTKTFEELAGLHLPA